MSNRLQEMLHEGMKKKTESVSLSDDLWSRTLGLHSRRTVMRRRLVAGGGIVGVVALAAGLVFGVALAQGGGQPSGSQVAVKARASNSAAGSTTGPTTKDGKLSVTFVSKVQAAITPAKGEILHVKETIIDYKKGTKGAFEYWSTSGTDWKYHSRVSGLPAGALKDEVTCDYTGLIEEYDAKTNTISERRDVGVTKKVPDVDGGMGAAIKQMLASDDKVVVGHGQIEGRNAKSITEKMGKGADVLFLDEKTGFPIEWRIGEFGEEDRVILYDVFEKLPATAENLKLLDLEASHPGATTKAGL